MSVFLILMVIGLTGLVVMALPAFGNHADIGTSHGFGDAGHVDLPSLQGPDMPSLSADLPGPSGTDLPDVDVDSDFSPARFIPSPRMIFSLLALYGVFGNLFSAGMHLPMVQSSLLALLPAILLERFAVTPIWKAMLSAQGKPSSPLEALTLNEAEAVTPFRNGKGIVVMERDGRSVQFTAQLLPEQAHMPVRVGDRLRVEEVDAARERMTVSMLH